MIGKQWALSCILFALVVFTIETKSVWAQGGFSPADSFRRMDRNQDSDVSIREFLAPRHLFDLLDTNHDQLLSTAEAEALSATGEE